MATAWSSIPTFSAGAVLTAAQMSTIANNLYLAGNGPTAYAYQTTAQTNIAAGTEQAITFTTGEVIDNDGMHSTSTNTARFVCVTAGYYLLQGCVAYSAPAGTNPLGAFWKKTSSATTVAVPGSFGSAYPKTTLNQLSTVVCTPTVVVSLAVNDYVYLNAYHEQGAAADLYVSGAHGEASSALVKWIAPS